MASMMQLIAALLYILGAFETYIAMRYTEDLEGPEWFEENRGLASTLYAVFWPIRSAAGLVATMMNGGKDDL